jgi:hypothetical protein
MSCEGWLLLGLCLPILGMGADELEADGFRTIVANNDSTKSTGSFRPADAPNPAYISVMATTSGDRVSSIIVSTCQDMSLLTHRLNRDRRCTHPRSNQFSCRFAPQGNPVEVLVCGRTIIIPGTETSAPTGCLIAVELQRTVAPLSSCRVSKRHD